MTDTAAALTYYGVLSIFPALIALISVVALVGDGATQPILDALADAPGPTSEILTDVVQTSARTGAGLPFALGIAAALWSASAFIGAFSRACNAIFDVREERPFWKLRPAQFGLTAAALTLLGIASAASVLSGPVAREFGDMIGFGAEAARTWDRAKLPGLLLVVGALIVLLMFTAPNVRFGSIRAVLPGAVVALVAWVAGSALLGLYFEQFADYGKSYGALGGVVAFLVWLWVSNIALLYGQLVNAELRQHDRGERI